MLKITIQKPFDPITYIHWGGNSCLYVGQSRRGLIRPFERAHRMWRYHDEITHTDIYQVKTLAESLALEKRLTRTLKPKYDESSLARGGIKNHARRMGKVPLWALDDEKIKELISLRFPKSKTDPVQRKAAARMIRLIYLYYRVGSTSGVIAEELNMTVNAVNRVILRLKKQMSQPLKPSHRPKKNTVGIQTTSEVE